MGIDPNNVAEAIDTGNSLAEHGELLVRVGIISAAAGIVGGTFAFFRDSRRFHIPFGPRLIFYYASKIGSAFLGAYLGLLVVPMFGIGTSAAAEQVAAILSAVMGADFIGLLLQRFLGERRTHATGQWNGSEHRKSITEEK